MCATALVWPIWLLFQKSFENGKIPEASKISRIAPVYEKKGNKSEVNNYRVIAIQSIVAKIHEIAVKNKITERIQPLLSTAQHGFRNKRSVVTNLLNLSMMAFKSFERSSQLDIVYGDFKTAFDTVWIRLIVSKIARFGFGMKTGRWLCEFLTGRTNYVEIDSITSRLYASPSGVPPGSSLGPQLFTMFINDIVEAVTFATVLLFADDIKLAAIITEPKDTTRVQNDINNII